ncbi:MAG: coniferyl aldehyde dehydrogenase [Burkholderiaceae bacterium]|nr:coniferyl aldehyde dehydrogenase [Burkholderiaceae bacterium]
MNAPLSFDAAVSAKIQRMNDVLNLQKNAYAKNPMPSAKERIERLARLRQVLLKQQDAIASAISDDFGNRSIHETMLGELATCLAHIAYYSRHVGRWMKPCRRHIGLLHQPAKAWVQYQPLGVVGIIAPWNYPLLLSVGPLICALAAGNHAMIKMSSSSSRFGALLERLLGEVFPTELVAIVNGGGPISDAFGHLPFDQITFTGSPSVGKTVMQAAAQNLVPVLLELGGKSPVIVHPSMSLETVAERLTFGKFWNAGQTCVAPDYVFLPRGKTAEFLSRMQAFICKSYPTLRNNADYTSIINDSQYQRLKNSIEEARAKGAIVQEINPANEDLSGTRKIAPTFISHINDDMTVAHQELFGPVLLIHEYDHIDEAVAYINSRPRPLALYYFDYDMQRAKEIGRRTHSGHFGINAVVTHFAQDDLAVGGVGNSGMGRYHGFEGFVTMSNARSVMSKPRLYALRVILPPFGRIRQKIVLKFMIR